jgi:hypothetical protein
MILGFNARSSTRDVDAIVLSPGDASYARSLVKTVASERDWPNDWCNDGAKSYLVGLILGPVVFSAPGILVRRPSTEQIFAMKLSAWRDDVDIADAELLLSELRRHFTRQRLWEVVQGHLVPGDELKAQYAYAELWERLDVEN